MRFNVLGTPWLLLSYTIASRCIHYLQRKQYEYLLNKVTFYSFYRDYPTITILMGQIIESVTKYARSKFIWTIHVIKLNILRLNKIKIWGEYRKCTCGPPVNACNEVLVSVFKYVLSRLELFYLKLKICDILWKNNYCRLIWMRLIFLTLSYIIKRLWLNKNILISPNKGHSYMYIASFYPIVYIRNTWIITMVLN